MEKNFRIGDGSNELICGDRLFDVHNCYDFSGLLVGADRVVQISFYPNREYGAGGPPVLLEFHEINYLELSPGFGTRSISVIDEMGYMNPDQRDDEWLVAEQQSTSADHLLFRLGSDFDFVRIHARRAHLRTGTSLRVATKAIR